MDGLHHRSLPRRSGLRRGRLWMARRQNRASTLHEPQHPHLLAIQRSRLFRGRSVAPRSLPVRLSPRHGRRMGSRRCPHHGGLAREQTPLLGRGHRHRRQLRNAPHRPHRQKDSRNPRIMALGVPRGRRPRRHHPPHPLFRSRIRALAPVP